IGEGFALEVHGKKSSTRARTKQELKKLPVPFPLPSDGCRMRAVTQRLGFGILYTTTRLPDIRISAKALIEA
ncbi:hypothetical protein NL388_31065, partial [Klebsiella pneumoniae]|nr:hypothetical protein [Klebsiella pneumoniae]